MKEYHKIDTIFSRDMQGTKKLILGKYRDPVVEYLKDNKWVFTEKIDGTNIRIYWDGHKITIGGRTENAQIPAHLFEHLQATFLTPETEQVFEEKFGETEVYLFGEGYGEKIQSGGDYGKIGFVLFDVIVDGWYLEHGNIIEIAKTFGIPSVPIIIEGTIDEAVRHIQSNPQSIFAENPRDMEGVVGTPVVRVFGSKNKRIIVKIKTKEFIV